MDAYMQELTGDAKAILMLCGRFGKSDATGSAKPLSLGEYNRLAEWMVGRNIRPADLITDGKADFVPGPEVGIDAERIRGLLSRGATMALAVEKWTHNGIWIVCRSDELYPKRLKKHLKKQAPPILFGVGDIGLLSIGGLAVVGSRNVDNRGEAFTRAVAIACAGSKMPIVSGGARGVDQISMISALEAGGKVIGILSDGLNKAAVAGKYRSGIREKRLVLVSPFYPEARFNVGNAMGRNKHIYAFADFALVVSAQVEKGGTWAGAKEELKRPCGRPVFVRLDEGVPEGNRVLMQLGAMPFPQPPWDEDLSLILKKQQFTQKPRASAQKSLFGEPILPAAGAFVREPPAPFEEFPGVPATEEIRKVEAEEDSLQSIYDAVLPILLNAMTEWKSTKEIAEDLDVRKVQIDDWLNRAVKDGNVDKTNRPIRYRRKQHQSGTV